MTTTSADPPVDAPALDWALTLYVRGASTRSARAILAARRLCEEMEGPGELTVIDITDDLRAAVRDGVVAVPCLVRRLPEPRRLLVGDLADLDVARRALELTGGDRERGETPADRAGPGEGRREP